MSKTRKLSYGELSYEPLDVRGAMQEATRCLLCEDAPCSQDCPAKTDPGKFIRSIRFRNFKGAAETIRENNILGATCALVCPYEKLCEKACSRTGIDKPIEIGRLQSFAMDQERIHKMQVLKKGESIGKKVACIGSGPASLAAAAELAKNGVDVTIYEQYEKAGGVLRYGINPSRLSRNTVDYDISKVEELGVKFEFGKKITYDQIEDLKKEYDAVFVGVGLWKTWLPEIEGIDLKGVYTAVDFLKEMYENDGKIELGEDVVIVGGGDVAMDCATSAKQAGAKNVSIVYRRSIEEAPANIQELSYAYSLGVPVHTRFAPEKIHGDGKVELVEFKSWDEVSTMNLKASTVVFAIGQKLEDDYEGVKKGNGVFIAGDARNGGETVVKAVAEGKGAALEILAYLK
uniref:FAD-dependent oxidoreductase n=1 Tax=Anaerococcus mediterraneensis TaxID=1870984 RepID=UPI00093008AA|nr:FAD-dependent oxidoreductase [Anaerococcus mediterraneensis]